MKLNRLLILLLLSFVLCLALVPLGLVGHDWKLLVAALAYFAVTFYLLQKTGSPKEKWVVAAIMAIPPLVLFGPSHLNDFRSTLFSLPSTLAHFAGIAFALLAQAFQQKKARVFLGTFLVLLTTLATVKGYPLWLNKVNFGTFTGKVNDAMPAPMNGVLQNQQVLKNEDLQGKVVVLDFWHSKCGVCFTKFPQLQKLYEKYKSDSSLKILAVNKPLKTDTAGHAFAILKNRNYTFPILIPSDSLLAEAFEVHVYPTVVVVDKAGTIVFRGDIENASKVVDGLLSNDK